MLHAANHSLQLLFRSARATIRSLRFWRGNELLWSRQRLALHSDRTVGPSATLLTYCRLLFFYHPVDLDFIGHNKTRLRPSTSPNKLVFLMFFLTVHHSIEFSKYQLSAQFFYSSTIYMLHYTPQHVSSNTLLIIRRTNCITTASGIVTLCEQPYSMHLHTFKIPT